MDKQPLEEPKSNGNKTSLQPCNCKSCGGALKDRRTIRRHFSCDPYPNRHRSNGDQPKDYSSTLSSNHETCVSVSGEFHVVPSCVYSNVFAANEEASERDSNVTDNEIIEDDIASGADNSSISESSINNPTVYTDKEIDKVILRIIESKVKNGWSQEETLSQIRNIYELIHDERLPHKSWNAVIKFLQKLGYTNPKHYKVCCESNDHVTLLNYKEDCPNCGSIWDSCQDYFVLGLQLESYFLDQKTIKDHLAHWENKSDWFNKGNTETPFKEIWHGKRFRELSYFWDTSKDEFLPVCCLNCDNVISAKQMEQSLAPGKTLDSPVTLSCEECSFTFNHRATTLKGCPLNQAFIFHEDGFNAFSLKSRGVAAIHISSACITKEQRSSGNYMKVYSFIPSFVLKEGITHKIDAFIKPLIEEIKDMYLNGINVNVELPLSLRNGEVLQPGNYQVRALLLLGTADLKGHQEMTLYAGGGKVGCRRCQVNGTYIPAKRHYYYGEFGRRFRQPCEMKTAEYHKLHGKRVDNAISAAERSRLQTETGVSGLSVLFELHSLYQFDPIQDMTIDRMHLTFNMLKREFTSKMWAELGENANRLVNARDPNLGGLIDRGEFGIALNAVSWPVEERDSGVAKLRSFTDKLGSWKTNEFKKFSAVAREVLAEKIPSKAYDSFVLLCDAVQMLFSKALRKSGWSPENIVRLDTLLWSHAISAEEYYGLGFCTENLEYSVHAGNEIKRHSSMDNYSCELYERAIRIHKKQKHNSKGLEKTFVVRECLRNFIECYKRRNGPISDYSTGEAYKFQVESLNNDIQFYFHENSYKAASKLLDEVNDLPQPNIKHALRNGVAIGQIKTKLYTNANLSDIRRFFGRELGLLNQEIPRRLQTLKAVVLFDQFQEQMKISKSDYCKIKSTQANDEEWIMKIDSIIQVGPLQGQYYRFVNGSYFVPLFQNGQVLYHQWTETPKYVERNYSVDSVQPIIYVRRKVIMYPEPQNIQDPNFFLCIDFKNAELTKRVNVPIYPDVNDTVKVKGRNNEKWYGKVHDVNYNEREAYLQWYKLTRRNDVWMLMNDQDKVNFRSILGLAIATRTFGGFTINDI